MSEITKALIKFQGLVKNPPKNSENPHFKSSYVNLDGLLEAVKKPLTECGILLIQQFEAVEGQAFLVTRLIHESGDSMESRLLISPERANAQGLGSAITYLRRYSIESICGICGTEDDDANKAVESGYPVKSPGMRKTIPPSEKQKKYYFELLKEYFKGSVPDEDIEAAKAMDVKAMSEAIQEIKQELGK